MAIFTFLPGKIPILSHLDKWNVIEQEWGEQFLRLLLLESHAYSVAFLSDHWDLYKVRREAAQAW